MILSLPFLLSLWDLGRPLIIHLRIWLRPCWWDMYYIILWECVCVCKKDLFLNEKKKHAARAARLSHTHTHLREREREVRLDLRRGISIRLSLSLSLPSHHLDSDGAAAWLLALSVCVREREGGREGERRRWNEKRKTYFMSFIFSHLQSHHLRNKGKREEREIQNGAPGASSKHRWWWLGMKLSLWGLFQSVSSCWLERGLASIKSADDQDDDQHHWCQRCLASLPPDERLRP